MNRPALPDADAPIKCVVWDLDNTLWDGVLLEGGGFAFREGVDSVLHELDRRGILHAIASKNEPEDALRRLEELHVLDLFVEHEIGWGAKSASVRRIAARLNIGEDSVLFVDDDPYELDEVACGCPAVRCQSATDIASIVDRLGPPGDPTPDAGRRRLLYQQERRRLDAEAAFEGRRDGFLASLAMRLTVRCATADDLDRASELTLRTNQLNTTRRTFSRADLDELALRPDRLLLVCDLSDRYGEYGTVGLAVVALSAKAWRVQLFLMSCRAVARGAGTAFLRAVMARAATAEAELFAEFAATPRNRQMLVTLRFNGFRPAGEDPDGWLLLRAPSGSPAPVRHIAVSQG